MDNNKDNYDGIEFLEQETAGSPVAGSSGTFRFSKSLLDTTQVSDDGNSRNVEFSLLPDNTTEEAENEESGASEENDVTLLPDDAAKSLEFFFKGTFLRRLFRSQMRPREIGTMNVGGDTVPEVIGFMWKLAKKHVSRQVDFDNDVPTWSEKQMPDEEDIERFIILHDTTKRKTYNVSAITPRILATWKDKNIKVFVHPYATNVETHAQHQMVLKTLITPTNSDRAGAHSTRDCAALAKELKETHLDLEGHQSSWMLWANFIHSSPAHKQEQLKIDPAPPLELAKYFRWTNVSEAARLQSVHRGVTVAHTVNAGWVKEAAEIREEISAALGILNNVSRKLEAMITKGLAAGDFITAVQSAIRPEESEVSQVLAEKVTDCPDVDHS
ncbi:uncharacterized protein LOC129780238 [Toxorhynchites rutilus septentrionalis]|uniref:uncharacterized protein LOC129767286 n=1 Tax=Toxorhynchites rutilus septentrionalis TaxID=329112 RepID=UPI00247AE836|nr:uncharacterized protein LOC129767286 [Toxorhynchites rutilus septentrionalis]XP_055644264.1 uncharacterized protein LOC129780238 [Toxorhynchites rutilus septentrionalis]